MHIISLLPFGLWNSTHHCYVLLYCQEKLPKLKQTSIKSDNFTTVGTYGRHNFGRSNWSIPRINISNINKDFSLSLVHETGRGNKKRFEMYNPWNLLLFYLSGFPSAAFLLFTKCEHSAYSLRCLLWNRRQNNHTLTKCV